MIWAEFHLILKGAVMLWGWNAACVSGMSQLRVSDAGKGALLTTIRSPCCTP